LFAAVVLLTHLPAFYDATLRRPLLHYGEHVAFLLAGLLVFAPLLDVEPAAGRRLGGLGRLVYLIAAGLPMALVGAYLNGAQHVVYAPYADASRALGSSPLLDQQRAGAIMWVGGALVMIAVGLSSVVAAMVAEERRLAVRERALDAAHPLHAKANPPSAGRAKA
jgi:cytochrome c oxidase assembly factor CtaG